MRIFYLKFMKPEETIFDGISDSEMESISGGIAEVQSESQSESAAGDGYAVKCCNNKLKTKDEEKEKYTSCGYSLWDLYL